MVSGGKGNRKYLQNCVLCLDAPCDKACPKALEPSRQIRSIWFENEKCAAARLPKETGCAACAAPCEAACVKGGEVPIQKIMQSLQEEVKPKLTQAMPDEEEALRTELCGIPLENPFLLASSVVGSNYDMCARAFEAGWAGVSFKTICGFPIREASPRFSAIYSADGSMMGFKNIEQLSDHSVAENMAIFRQLKKNYPQKFILASIMGQNDAEWTELARLCQENGADALELNFSCPNMMEEGLGSDIGQVPALVERFTAAARRGASIPLLAKLTPNVARMSPAAEAALAGGADGLSAINTIKSLMAVNPDTYVSSPDVNGRSAVGGYSGNAVKPIALRFIAELAQNPKLRGLHLSGMGGVETWQDALEFMLLGAGSIQVATAVMQYGYRIIEDLKSGLAYYLQVKGFNQVRDVVGLGLASVSATTDALERESIVYPKFNRKTCIGCGRCQISCMDGGHQAICFDEGRRPILDAKKCVGCHLCVLVCPTESIGSSGKRISKNG